MWHLTSECIIWSTELILQVNWVGANYKDIHHDYNYNQTMLIIITKLWLRIYGYHYNIHVHFFLGNRNWAISLISNNCYIQVCT